MRDAIAINLALRNGISTVELTTLNVGDIEFRDTGAVIWVSLNNERNSCLLAPEVEELIKRYFALRDNPSETEPFLIGTSNNNKNKHLTTDGLRMLTRKRLLNSGIPKELCNLGALRNTKKLDLISSDSTLKEIEELLNFRSEINRITNYESRFTTTIMLDDVLGSSQD